MIPKVQILSVLSHLSHPGLWVHHLPEATSTQSNSFCKSFRKRRSDTCCLVKPISMENHLPFGCIPKEEVSFVSWRFKTCTGNSLSQVLGLLHSLVLRNNRQRYHDDPGTFYGASWKHLRCRQLFDFTVSIHHQHPTCPWDPSVQPMSHARLCSPPHHGLYQSHLQRSLGPLLLQTATWCERFLPIKKCWTKICMSCFRNSVSDRSNAREMERNEPKLVEFVWSEKNTNEDKCHLKSSSCWTGMKNNKQNPYLHLAVQLSWQLFNLFKIHIPLAVLSPI